MASSRTELVKGLGFYAATSVVVGTMIGQAIFIVPSKMLRLVGTPWMVFLVWICAGALSLFGALGYAELGAAIPEAGGEYAYVHRAYSPLLGFVYSWVYFTVAKTASIAAIATGFVIYLSYFFPGLAEVIWQVQPALSGHSMALKLTGLQVAAAIMILLLSGLNVLGVRRAGAVQTLFTASKLVVLGVIIALGLTLGHGSFEHFHSVSAAQSPAGFLRLFGLATVSALWAYDGWNNLSMVAGEVENPQRNMPRAIIIGSVLVIVVYLLVNLAYFYVLAPSDIAGTQTVAADTARQFLGKAGGAFVAVGVMISTFATLNGSILTGSRIPYAAARDRLFPAALARVHPKFCTPAVAIIGQATIAAVFALTGQYDALYTKVIFSEFLFYFLCTAAIFILRKREPDLPRPYRTWGYPLVPAVFLLLAFALLVNTFREQRADSLWGLGLMLSGVPIYFLWKLWARRETR